eukprot:TRINITY_DN47289_c0_g1_i1.p1 TRINITY_DN47289_c0_g1~~TRINITY_DN47289_c0_g1_i1.p1  ORF type:complete len:484 (+),score=97.61 TRINITY_DN47289_c0_g1_i1:81-1454(+)
MARTASRLPSVRSALSSRSRSISSTRSPSARIAERSFSDELESPSVSLWPYAFLVLAVIVLSALAHRDDSDRSCNLKLATVFCMAVAVVAAAGSVHGSPAKKVVVGAATVYVTLLLALCLQNPDDARAAYSFFNPRAGGTASAASSSPGLPQRFASCFYHAVWQVGVWAVLVVIIRDWRVAMLLSGVVELGEATLQVAVPALRESPAQRIVLDWILCNSGGIYLGYSLLRRLGAGELGPYNWSAATPLQAARLQDQRQPPCARFHCFSARAWRAPPESPQYGVFDCSTRMHQVAAIVLGGAAAALAPAAAHEALAGPGALATGIPYLLRSVGGLLCSYYAVAEWKTSCEDTTGAASQPSGCAALLASAAAVALELLLADRLGVRVHPTDSLLLCCAAATVFYAVYWSTRARHCGTPWLARLVGTLAWATVASFVSALLSAAMWGGAPEGRPLSAAAK